MTTPINLGALARALGTLEQHLRRKGTRVILITGARGCVKPIGDNVVVVMREGVVAGELTQSMIDTGLLAVNGDILTIARLPEEAECRLLRELLGLHRGSSNWIGWCADVSFDQA